MASPTPASEAKNSIHFSVIAAGIISLATVFGFAYLFSLWISSGDVSPEQTLRLASAQYVAGNVSVAGDLAATVSLEVPDDVAEEISLEDQEAAEQTQQASETKEDEWIQKWLPTQQFLIGAGKFANAMQQESPRDRRLLLEQSLPFLERARQLTFPEGRSADGHRMLGLAYYQVGKYSEATESLQKAIEEDLTLNDELVTALAIARAKRPQKDLNAAIEAIDRYLTQDSLDLTDRIESELMRIDWLIDMKRFDDAATSIQSTRDRIEPVLQQQTPRAFAAADRLTLKRARWLVQKTLFGIKPGIQSRIVDGIPTDAYEQISPSQRQDLMDLIRELGVLQREGAPKVIAQSRLIAAQAFLLAGSADLALAELTQVRQQRPFRDEGLDGGLAEMELLADQGRGPEVLQTIRYIVREISQSRYLNFTPQREAEFRGRISETLSLLRIASQYEPVIEITDAIDSLVGKANALIEKGIAYREWGEAALKEGVGPGGETSREAFELARLKFRGAGDAFSLAADELFTTNDYVPTLWSAIESYQRGRHFTKSIVLLEHYLRYEDRMRTPRGLVAHGRALLADGRPQEAMESLQDCIIEFERDPMRYEARLLAAQAAADAHDDPRAKQLLMENLSDGQLTPQSPVWRDSLFTLAELLYSESDLQTLAALELNLPERIEKLREIEPNVKEALRRLGESVDRYWPLPRAQAAAHLVARTHLIASKLPENELKKPGLVDSVERDLRQRANRHRQAALDRYTSMVRYLDTQERDADLSDKQQAILRNSLLGQADTLKAMQRYSEAADAYREMALRYMNEPPALEALLGQARMIRLLGRDREADLLVRQAAVVLKRIGDQWDDRFDEMTRFSRIEWEKYLTWMTRRLENG